MIVELGSYQTCRFFNNLESAGSQSHISDLITDYISQNQRNCNYYTEEIMRSAKMKEPRYHRVASDELNLEESVMRPSDLITDYISQNQRNCNAK